MNWRSVLLENWPYKLAALLLGLLLWVNVAVEERAERPFPVEVEWVMEDSGFVLVDAPSRVQATFQGQGSELFTVAGASPRVRYVLDSVTAGTRTVRIPTDSVRYPSSANVRVTGVRPSSVELVIERRAQIRLPVRPDLEVSAAAGYQVTGEPRIEPDSVTVLGAESEVRGLAGAVLTTRRETLDEVTGTERVDLTVQVPEGLRTVELRPQIVLATVRVDTVVERRFRLPVTDTSGLLAGGLRPTPDSVTVTVQGPAGAVRSLTARAVQAVLEGAPPTEAGRSIPVSVILPDTMVFTGTADPPRVELTRPGGP